MTIEKITAELKKQFPTLTAQINDNVYELDKIEYETKINEWANNELLSTAKEEAQATAKAALLEKLGITDAEAKLLLL
jgi:hypothetical protein